MSGCTLLPPTTPKVQASKWRLGGKNQAWVRTSYFRGSVLSELTAMENCVGAQSWILVKACVSGNRIHQRVFSCLIRGVVLVCCGCHNKIPQSWFLFWIYMGFPSDSDSWPPDPPFLKFNIIAIIIITSSKFWWLEVRDHGVSGLVSSETSSSAGCWPFPSTVFPHGFPRYPCVSSCPLCMRTPVTFD